MKHILFSLIIICSLAFNSFAQNEQTLITIGNTKVTKAEFERIYKKNNNNLYDEADKKSPEDYLELFINFKLKVIEAETLNMDTNSVFINELAGYRTELAAPYLTDVKYNDQMIKELYDRMTKEVNASHILLKVEKNATEDEDLIILKKISKIREEIIAGKDFGEAAFKYSEDPSAKTNRGDLSYFTAFQMVVPFENAAFTTPFGEISEPFRSSFGYHILKVHNIRENRGEILVAHIMKTYPQGATPKIKAEIKTAIDDIYKELVTGADFAELAKEKSDDKRSAEKGGEMPWFAAGRMLKGFADPAFAIENIGDYTKPIETRFGYHIIKKLDQRGVASFEDSREKIETSIKRDPQRSITSKTIFINKLKLEYNYSENSIGLELLKGKKIGDRFEEVNFDLFSLNEKTYNFGELRRYIQNNKITTGTYSASFNSWVETEITIYEDSRLEEKYPDFRYLMQEYHDGILLFNISEEKIWNFSVKDSVGLEAFYNKNSKQYLWEERFAGSIFKCKDKNTREEVDKFLSAGMTNEEITDRMNSDKKMVTIDEGAWEKGNNPIVDYYIWNQAKPENFDEEITFVRGDKIKPEYKILSQARGLYISDYQNYLEQEWIKYLREKYVITIDKKLLKTIKGV